MESIKGQKKKSNNDILMIYKIMLSSGDSIPIDGKDLPMLYKQMEEGSHNIITGEGSFNPSFYVSIVPDYDKAKLQRERFEEQAYKLVKEGDKMVEIAIPEKDREPYLKSPLRQLLKNKMDMKQLDKPRKD